MKGRLEVQVTRHLGSSFMILVITQLIIAMENTFVVPSQGLGAVESPDKRRRKDFAQNLKAIIS
jgi:hypothetical protein